MAEGRIHAALIIEILGRPPEYIKETLSSILDNIGKEKNTEIKSSKIHEPKKIEESEVELYSTFAEIEIETEFMPLLRIIFTYMPSHIEIISPEYLNLKNHDISIILNETTRRLHQYDEIAKRLGLDRNILEGQLRQAGILPATVQMEQQAQQLQQKTQIQKQKAKKKAAKKPKKK